jgi:hypothetical protein
MRVTAHLYPVIESEHSIVCRLGDADNSICDSAVAVCVRNVKTRVSVQLFVAVA